MQHDHVLPGMLEVKRYTFVFLIMVFAGRIVLYESQPSGIVRQAYQFIDELLEMCVEQIQNCACEDGCPACKYWDGVFVVSWNSLFIV